MVHSTDETPHPGVILVTSDTDRPSLDFGYVAIHRLEIPMASRCINPQCEDQSSFFGAGALYAFQEHEAAHSRRHMQYLWLCASCAAHCVVRTDGAGKVIVVSRSHAEPFKVRDAAGKLRLIFRSKRVPLPRAAARAGVHHLLSGDERDVTNRSLNAVG